MQNLKPLACLCSWAGRFESYLVRNHDDRFSRDEALLEYRVRRLARITNNFPGYDDLDAFV